jgi:NADH:ubiquinone oxidoreductase subunit 3 (subunit A)
VADINLVDLIYCDVLVWLLLAVFVYLYAIGVCQWTSE